MAWGSVAARCRFVAHDLFDRQLPRADSPEEPTDAFQPDAVIIFLGHNDVLVSQRAGDAFPCHLYRPTTSAWCAPCVVAIPAA